MATGVGVRVSRRWQGEVTEGRRPRMTLPEHSEGLARPRGPRGQCCTLGKVKFRVPEGREGEVM